MALWLISCETRTGMEKTLFPGSFSFSSSLGTSGGLCVKTKVKLACYRQAQFFLPFTLRLSDSLFCCVTDLCR